MRRTPRAVSPGTIPRSASPGRSMRTPSSRRATAPGHAWPTSSRSADMRIAITGASGLIGHAVAKALADAGHAIVTVGRRADCAVRVDLAADASLPAGALKGCDALVHAAGVTDEDFADRDAAFAKALRGTQALLAAARDAGVGRLAYFSSAHVYGPLEGRLDEASPVNP